jgi:hypothetical protein
MKPCTRKVTGYSTDPSVTSGFRYRMRWRRVWSLESLFVDTYAQSHISSNVTGTTCQNFGSTVPSTSSIRSQSGFGQHVFANRPLSSTACFSACYLVNRRKGTSWERHCDLRQSVEHLCVSELPLYCVEQGVATAHPWNWGSPYKFDLCLVISRPRCDCVAILF